MALGGEVADALQRLVDLDGRQATEDVVVQLDRLVHLSVQDQPP